MPLSWEWSFFLVTLGVALATIVVLRWRFRLAMAVLALGFATTAGAALWSEARSEQSRQEEIFTCRGKAVRKGTCPRMRVARVIPPSTRAGTGRTTAR